MGAATAGCVEYRFSVHVHPAVPGKHSLMPEQSESVLQQRARIRFLPDQL